MPCIVSGIQHNLQRGQHRPPKLTWFCRTWSLSFTPLSLVFRFPIEKSTVWSINYIPA